MSVLMYFMLFSVGHAMWQRIHRWGPTYHRERRSALNGLTMEVKQEVHSDHFKGPSQHSQGPEFDDE